MPICRHCAQLAEDDRILCPYCYTPLKPTSPPSRQARPIIALIVLLVALLWLVRSLVVRWVN